MNIEDTLAPASDQLDAIELVAGPRTFTVASVSKGSLEQPVNVHFIDFPRPWRPSKGMRRVLAACWGAEASEWAGRSVRLFFDPEVTFGKEKPGGTRISHLSHIDGTKKIPLLITRGKSAIYTVEPLPPNDPPNSGGLANEAAEMVAAFEQRAGINRANLEAHIGRPVTEWTTEDLADLRTLGGQIARGEKTAEDVFGAGGE